MKDLEAELDLARRNTVAALQLSTQWQEAALKTGLYRSDTDVSTPAKWLEAQAHAAAELAQENDKLKGLVAMLTKMGETDKQKLTLPAFAVVAYEAAAMATSSFLDPAFDAEGLLPLGEQQRTIVQAVIAGAIAQVTGYIATISSAGHDTSALVEMGKKEFDDACAEAFGEENRTIVKFDKEG